MIVIVGFLNRKLEAQYIPNSGLEVWDYYNTWTLEPQYWETPNDQLIQSVVQDSNAFAGELAMRVGVLPGIEGGLQQVAMLSFPADYLPYAIGFAVKCYVPDADPEDNVSVTVEYRHSGNTLGFETWASFTSIPEWQEHMILLPPIDIAIDELRIHVAAGYIDPLASGSWDTWISVDEFSISNGLSAESESEIAFEFYPNPVKDKLMITDHRPLKSPATIRIFNSTGTLVSDSQLGRELDLSALPPGLYHLQVFSENDLVSVKTVLHE